MEGGVWLEKEKKFTREQIKKARDYKHTFREIYVEPVGKLDKTVSQKENE